MPVPRMLLRTLIVGATAVATLLPACAALADPTIAEVNAQIEQAQNKLEDVIEEFNGVTENLKDTKAEAAKVAARLQATQQQLSAAEASMRKLASAAYRSGGGLTTASLLLTAGSSDNLVDQMTALRHVSRARQREIDQFTQLKRGYESDQKRQKALLAKQTKQQQDLAARRKTIEADIRELEALKRRLNVPPPPPPDTGKQTPPKVSGKAGVAVSFAYNQLGKPYVYGAAGPSSYDCSGLTMAAWAKAGVSLTHRASIQWKEVAHISRSALKPGDLVFYRSLGHVAIYVGSSTVIHAPHTGDVVRKASVDMMTPYGFGRPG